MPQVAGNKTEVSRCHMSAMRTQPSSSPYRLKPKIVRGEFREFLLQRLAESVLGVALLLPHEQCRRDQHAARPQSVAMARSHVRLRAIGRQLSNLAVPAPVNASREN